MIKIGLVTTWAPERCGHRTYAEELVASVKDPDIEFKIIDRPFGPGSITDRIRDCDVVHVNHAWQLFGDITHSTVMNWRAMGKKTVCTFHESTSDNRGPLTMSFDRVVVHWKTSDGFTHIPDGILHSALKVGDYGHLKDYIGVVGFPFEYKNYPLSAMVARMMHNNLLAFIPESLHADATAMCNRILSVCPSSTVITDFAPQEKIIDMFSQCAFTMFPYSHTGSGIGGSVRLGIAAQRPVLITNVVRYADLLADYKDEFYVVENPYPTYEDILLVAESIIKDIEEGKEKIPRRSYEDMDWKKSAAKYVQIYKELMS